jgi:BA14K-like protein
MKLKFALSLLFMTVIIQPVFADKLDYCKAFARDFADARSVDETTFQHKYDISYRACMGKLKVAAKKIVTLKKETTVGPLNLVPGSADWNIFCANKYASFNKTKGTYKSFTGVDRKCIVSLK